MIYTTAHLHDIGKIGVKDYILFKAGRLNKGEWRVIRTHPIVGEEVLRPLSLSDHLPLSIRHHHE
jgi:HD-GYP domain-containing protein (c-di-GMP phosphodiesterase class II)